MRPLLVASILLIFALSRADAQSEWKEHILKVQKLDESTVYRISRRLSGMEGVHFSGYCCDASCLLIKYDPAVVKNPERIQHAIRSAGGALRMTEVKGYTIFEVIDGRMNKPVRTTREVAMRK